MSCDEVARRTARTVGEVAGIAWASGNCANRCILDDCDALLNQATGYCQEGHAQSEEAHLAGAQAEVRTCQTEAGKKGTTSRPCGEVIVELDLVFQEVQEALWSSDPHYAQTRKLIEELRAIIGQRIASLSERNRITDALGLVIDVHFLQKDRPDGQPYVNHPLDVALCVVREYGVEEADVIVAALLHDSVEDQSAKVVERCKGEWRLGKSLREQALDEIRQRYGERVADLVSKLSNPVGHEEAKSRAEKNLLYLGHVKSLYDGDEYAFLIKMADFSQNALRLSEVRDTARRSRLRVKYCPVIEYVRERLEKLNDPLHPIYGAKKPLLRRLQEAFEEECANF